MTVNGEEFVTAMEAAEILRCTRRAVYGYIKAGKLTASKPLNKWLIRRSDLDDMLNDGKELK